MTALLERLAEQLAIDAVEQAKRANDEGVIDAVAKSLADTSTTFKDAYLTCVRYIQADERARQTLPNLDPKPEALHLPAPEPERPAEEPQTASQPEEASAAAKASDEDTSLAEDDPGYAEVEYLDDETVEFADTYSSAPASSIRGPAPDAETPAAEPEITGPRRRGH